MVIEGLYIKNRTTYVGGVQVAQRGVAQVAQLPLDAHRQGGIVGVEQLHPLVGLVGSLADGHDAVYQGAADLESILDGIRVLQAVHYNPSQWKFALKLKDDEYMLL